jgi:hypothetical protein
MKKMYCLLMAMVLVCTVLKAQPILGTTDFAVNGTISWNTNSPCVATKTADVQGWLVSVNSTSNCGINQSNAGSFPDSDGRLQYLVGFGTLSQASFGTDDGSEFALVNLAWSSSTYSFASKSISFVGYRNGLPVSGATLVATTGPSPWSATSNSTLVNFSGNPNFSNVDNVLIIPTQTCSSILALEQITISTPSVCLTSPTVTLVGSSNVSCNGGSNGSATVSASGAGPFTYAWSPSGGTSSSAIGLSAGVYTCAVTNSCSISSAQTVTITQPSAIVTSTAVTNVACNGGSNGVAAISASGGAGGYTYLWSNGATTSAITGLLAGAYSATVTDANNCKSIKSAIVTQPSAIVTSTAVTNVACNGGSNGVASITASGGAGSYTYLWSNGATTSAITGLLAGAYSATVTDANSCKSIKNAVVTQPSALVTSTAVTNVACNGGNNGVASITASGGAGSYTYLWSNGGTTSAITGLLAGAYSATVTDANSCTSIKSAIITQPSAIVTSTAVTNVACNGGSNGVSSITASGGVGGYTYLWSNGATTSAITGLLAGAYSATVTDANSCTSSKGAVITQPSALITSTAVTNVACNGGSNGSATLTASGGVGSYTYLWSNGATTSSVSGLLAVLS